MSVDADYIKQEELDASYLLVATISTLRSSIAELEAELAGCRDFSEELEAQLEDVKTEAANDYRDMRRFQDNFINADQERITLRSRIAELEAKIAAAPMLLEACKAVVDSLFPSPQWEVLKKAIAAAEGRERDG